MTWYEAEIRVTQSDGAANTVATRIESDNGAVVAAGLRAAADRIDEPQPIRLVDRVDDRPRHVCDERRGAVIFDRADTDGCSCWVVGTGTLTARRLEPDTARLAAANVRLGDQVTMAGKEAGRLATILADVTAQLDAAGYATDGDRTVSEALGAALADLARYGRAAQDDTVMKPRAPMNPPRERTYDIRLNRAETERLRAWLDRPNGSCPLGRRLTIDAVEGGGLLVRAEPYRFDDRAADRQPERCTQCGKLFTERACGPTHALRAALGDHDTTQPISAAVFDQIVKAFANGRVRGWTDGVRWAAAESDAQARGRYNLLGDIVDFTDHLRLCASDPERQTLVDRDQAPEVKP